jgi:UDP-glucuronate 4-epimerase
LKHARLKSIGDSKSFEFFEIDIADADALNHVLKDKTFTRIVHLAAQAGVRYSITNPRSYVDSNLLGHANILQLAREREIENTVYASSSSVYGGNTKTPFSEDDMTDDPVSLYGATKKSNELLSNSYARLYGLPLTGLRFFTVYGPWGRPDMAYWIFSEKLMKDEPIQIFNQGKMSRDFTFVEDIVSGILAALNRPVTKLGLKTPHRVYNLGNDQPEQLMDLVTTIEKVFGKELIKNFEDMQKGDVKRTWADITRAKAELGYQPKISLQEGIEKFAHWFKPWYAENGPMISG